MKNTIVTATALFAGAALVAAYYIKKRKAAKEMGDPATQRPGQHRSNIFSRAKDRSAEL